ncbi:MAG: anthranilate phosphoribosyltransferase [Planctomycetota bacterium]
MGDIHDILARLATAQTLGEHETERLFEMLLTGGLDEAQIGAILALLATRPPTADELTGAARVMRKHVTPVPFRVPDGGVLLDTCGTGGTPKAFNVSTVSAIIAAAVNPPPGRPRVHVAKHGNRSRTGRGSAEVLAALGINVDASPQTQARCLREAGVCFCFAIHHHPAMKHAAASRRSLGIPTIFNTLGPLTNPAGADYQVIGVYDPSLLDTVAETLRRLGTQAAAVLHARDGLDEASLADITDVAMLKRQSISKETIDPREVSLATASFASLAAASVQEASVLAVSIFNGNPGPRTDMALLNTAVGLLTCGVADSLAQGIDLARSAISSGSAMSVFETLRRVSQEPS